MTVVAGWPKEPTTEPRPDVCPPIHLRAEEGPLQVQLDASLYGQPRRRRRPPAAWIEPGHWLRWQIINYRSPAGHGGYWMYYLHTINIAMAPVARDLFLGVPDRHISELASLR